MRFYLTTKSNSIASKERAEEIAARGASSFNVVRSDGDGWRFYMLARKPMYPNQRPFELSDVEISELIA